MAAPHRGGLIPFCHIILSKEKDYIYPSPLPCSVVFGELRSREERENNKEDEVAAEGERG